MLLTRAKANTATTGTGAPTLGAAVAPYQTWAAAGATSGQTYSYLIEDGASWEVGRGVFAAGVLTRPGPSTDTTFQSSTGALLALSGSATVACVAGVADFPSGGAGALIGYAYATAEAVYNFPTSNSLPIDSMSVTFDLPAAAVVELSFDMLLARSSGAMRLIFTVDGAELSHGTGETYEYYESQKQVENSIHQLRGAWPIALAAGQHTIALRGGDAQYVATTSVLHRVMRVTQPIVTTPTNDLTVEVSDGTNDFKGITKLLLSGAAVTQPSAGVAEATFSGGGGPVAYAYSETAITAETPTSATLVDSLTTTFTLAESTTVEVAWNLHMNNGAGNNGQLKTNVQVDGTAYQPGGAYDFFYTYSINDTSGGGPTSQLVHGSVTLTLAAGSHTIEIMGQAALAVFSATYLSRNLKVSAVG